MKYIMTDEGYEEFINNKEQYILPTIRAKLMYILSVRVGYTPDSLTAQVTSDPRLKASSGKVAGELNRLKNDGYIEVSE